MEPARRPRFHVGVMATCCLFLALSVVVARESSLSGARAPYATPATVVQQVHRTGPGSMTESTQPSRRPEIATSRHRQTRETLPRLAGSGEDYAGVPSAERRVRRSRLEPKVHEFPPEPLVFLPARGRRFGEGASVGGYPRTRADKRQLTIEQMLEKGDYFVPNRGKKAARSTGGTEPMKKNRFDELLGTDEYFFPNRGKKEYFLAYDGRPPRPLESRLRRNLLQNLANEHKDTFFSSRGKRMPEEIELAPVVEQEIREALSGSLAEDRSTTSAGGCAGVLAGEMFSNIGENTLTTGQTDPNAVLLNDDVLLPFARVVS